MQAESSRRIALIVGAGSGLGAALARRFAADAYEVIAAARSAHKLRVLETELGALTVAIRPWVERF